MKIKNKTHRQDAPKKRPTTQLESFDEFEHRKILQYTMGALNKKIGNKNIIIMTQIAKSNAREARRFRCAISSSSLLFGASTDPLTKAAWSCIILLLS